MGRQTGWLAGWLVGCELIWKCMGRAYIYYIMPVELLLGEVGCLHHYEVIRTYCSLKNRSIIAVYNPCNVQ